MKRKVKNVRPTQTLTLEFEDEISMDLKFNAYTIMLLDEEFEDGSIGILYKAIKKPYAEGSKVVYAGLKSCNEDITYEEARNITTMLDMQTIMEIINMANDSVSPEDNKKKVTLSKEEIEILGQIYK